MFWWEEPANRSFSFLFFSTKLTFFSTKIQNYASCVSLSGCRRNILGWNFWIYIPWISLYLSFRNLWFQLLYIKVPVSFHELSNLVFFFLIPAEFSSVFHQPWQSFLAFLVSLFWFLHSCLTFSVKQQLILESMS